MTTISVTSRGRAVRVGAMAHPDRTTESRTPPIQGGTSSSNQMFKGATRTIRVSTGLYHGSAVAMDGPARAVFATDGLAG